MNHHAHVLTHNLQTAISMLDKLKKPETMQEIFDIGNKWESDQMQMLNDELKRNRKERWFGRFLTAFSVISMCLIFLMRDHYIIEEYDPSSGERYKRQMYKVGEPLTIAQQDLYLLADVRRFIECYEGYSVVKTNENRACIAAFSNKKVMENYLKYTNEKNPNGAFALLKAFGVINVRITRIKSLSQDKNTVAAEAILTPEGMGIAKNKGIKVEITLTYEYVNVPANAEKRERNPHGIKIKSYEQRINTQEN